ncbi:glutamate racemase [Thermocrinis minervae]|uniref:Glutamate racemase n=1 Tax=Thermocrinis minervae TaxID=381751 RepID=A0A1M6T8X7_9AQUI|nr:glutamate racemase [Thermocrinis minervae]SHK53324.1 glutamate racemase [Thermocrinis minervae]
MKVGVFDSGVGGLTVLKAIRDRFPSLDLVYLGDTARVPYGGRSKETVQRYSLECAQFLLDKGIELLVVACNTASALALEKLKETLDIPIVGVIEPGVKKALEVTREGRIGVIGTKATIKSGVYQRMLEDAGATVYAKACPMFVPMIEEGLLEGEIPKKIVDHYLRDLRGKVDTLVLGCTHYPLIKHLLQEYMGEDVQVVDSAESTALTLRNLIVDEGYANLELYFTDRSESMDFFVEKLLGREVSYEVVPILCKL